MKVGDWIVYETTWHDRWSHGQVTKVTDKTMWVENPRTLDVQKMLRTRPHRIVLDQLVAKHTATGLTNALVGLRDQFRVDHTRLKREWLSK